jgi:hypothetical protein
MAIERRMGKAENLRLPRCGHASFPKPVGFSGAKIKSVDQRQASNPFEIIHISRPGKGDGEILEWVHANAKTPRTPWEIEALVRLHGKEGTGK